MESAAQQSSVPFGFLSIAIANQAQTLDYSVTAFLATVDDCKWRY